MKNFEDYNFFLKPVVLKNFEGYNFFLQNNDFKLYLENCENLELKIILDKILSKVLKINCISFLVSLVKI